MAPQNFYWLSNLTECNIADSARNRYLSQINLKIPHLSRILILIWFVYTCVDWNQTFSDGTNRSAASEIGIVTTISRASRIRTPFNLSGGSLWAFLRRLHLFAPSYTIVFWKISCYQAWIWCRATANGIHKVQLDILAINLKQDIDCGGKGGGKGKEGLQNRRNRGFRRETKCSLGEASSRCYCGHREWFWCEDGI